METSVNPIKKYALSAKGRSVLESPAFWAELARLNPVGAARIAAAGWTPPADRFESRETRRRMAREARLFHRAINRALAP